MRAHANDQAFGYLSLYCEEKIRAAADLALLLFNGGANVHASTLQHLKAAGDDWNQFVSVTRNRYWPREIWLFGPFHWSLYSKGVQNDLILAGR